MLAIPGKKYSFLIFIKCCRVVYHEDSEVAAFAVRVTVQGPISES
jgi:hypothetical protein